MDQFDMFLRYTGLKEDSRLGFLRGVENHWLEAVAVFLENARGFRVLEAEVAVNWSLHADLAVLSPTVRTDLPGWENGAAPEITVIGSRFGRRAQELGITPRGWVRFTSEIRNDSPRHARLCREVGVLFKSKAPDWASVPRDRSYSVQDLTEVSATMREA